VRGLNRERIVAALRERGAVSRADLERATGLSRGTVASIVTELLRDGVLCQRGTDEHLKGRPPALLRLAAATGLTLAVDIGHRHVRAAIGDADGNIRVERFRPLDDELTPTDLLAVAAELVADLVAQAGGELARGELAGAVLGLPSPVNANGRPVTRAFGHLDLARRTGLSRLTRRISVMNDANLGALGEAAFGAARGISDFIFVKMSGGVGAGIMIGGRLYRGSGGVAGELAHVRVQEDGEWCVCGNRGCLETLVSASSLEAALQKAHPERGLVLADLPRLAALGDPAAEEIVYNAGWVTGRALVSVIHALNPAAVVVGGSLASLGEPLVTGLRDSIARHCQPNAVDGLEVLQAQCGERAEVLGALSLFRISA
jgi:predicted NBD/HSP70 family sugar kinase